MSLNITIDMLDKLGVLAKQAGVEIMKIYNSDFKVDTKADNSPVTEADQIAETMITEYIKSNITDAFPIIGEEAVTAGTPPELNGGPFWLIDALDGTKVAAVQKSTGGFADVTNAGDGAKVAAVHESTGGFADVSNAGDGTKVVAVQESTGGFADVSNARDCAAGGSVVSAVQACVDITISIVFVTFNYFRCKFISSFIILILLVVIHKLNF